MPIRDLLRPLLLASLTLAVLLCACVMNDDIAGRGSVNHSAPPPGPWVLVSLIEHEETPTVTITLVVDAKQRLSGQSGCNHWSGQWEGSEDRAQLGPLATTRKVCNPAIMEVEQRFLDALKRTGGWQMTDDGMLLTDSGKQGLLLFSLQSP